MLDWDLTLVSRSCTSTTLSLFDWLKLEDISISLFFVTVSRRNKKRHRAGTAPAAIHEILSGWLHLLLSSQPAEVLQHLSW